MELFELPKGWMWVRVEDISEKIQYGSSEKTMDDPRGIPVLRMGNIQDGNIIFEDLKYLPGDNGQLDEFILHDGDVLFNRTNSADLVGKSAVYKNPYPKAAFASYLIKVKVNKEVYDPDMLSYFINSPYGRRYISSVATQQVGQANVNGTKLSLMPVPLPPRIEQRKMVERIRSLISMVDEVEESVRQADYYIDRMNASVLAKAFTGKLVPQDLKDEPASVILERI
jgi:type I restriction enzyme S subunit